MTLGFVIGESKPTIVTAQTSRSLPIGEYVIINSKEGKIKNLTQNCEYNTNSVPDHLLKIVNAGGLLAELKNKIENNTLKTLRFRKDN